MTPATSPVLWDTADVHAAPGGHQLAVTVLGRLSPADEHNLTAALKARLAALDVPAAIRFTITDDTATQCLEVSAPNLLSATPRQLRDTVDELVTDAHVDAMSATLTDDTGEAARDEPATAEGDWLDGLRAQRAPEVVGPRS